MGALPSRESNEDPSTVFFANCGSHVVFHIPMTPHFFPSADCLAFQQLFNARNHQSALYCFDMKDVSAVLPAATAEAFRDAQDEDWGAEAEEPDPSVHYYDDEVKEKIKECGGTVSETEPSVGQHFRHAIEDPEGLYKVLIEGPTAGTMVDTDAEMCEIFEAEQKWRAAVLQEFSEAAKSQPQRQQQRMKMNRDKEDGGTSIGPSSRTVEGNGSNNDESEEDQADTNPFTSTLPPPPKKFLYPLPHAIALRMTAEEEEEMRAEYCQLHNIPYAAPRFHDVKPGSTPPTMTEESMAQLGVPRASSSTCFVACPMPFPLPLVERRRYHFEDDPKYRDGRVHLVEEHGVLYHFAYFPKKKRHNAAQKTGKAASSSATTGTAQASSLANTPIVLDRCLHDVVYSEEPDTSVSNNKQQAAASSSSPFGTAPNFSNEPEVAPAKRYGRCARCGARIEQRMNYTQLRRLKATRQKRREMRQEEELVRQQEQQHQHNASDPSSNTADDSDDAAAQREAWAAFAAARDAKKRAGHTDHIVDAAQGCDSEEAPGSDNDLEVASHTECVEEEGEAEFIINIAPVRIAGMDGLLPSRTRGTPWLRGYEREDEAAADAYVEQLEHKPPVMRICRFIEGSVGDKIVNRATLVTMLSYRPMCRQAGLSDALTRPVWSTCVLSNIPYLQMVRETFFRAKAAVAEIDDKDMLLRKWLDVVDRENNFYNFINANLYMMRNFTPPERTVRQHELPEDTNSRTTAGAGSCVADCFGNGSVGTGRGNSTVSSPLMRNPADKTAYGEGEGGDEQRNQRRSSTSRQASTDPLHACDHCSEVEENIATSAHANEHEQHPKRKQHHSKERAGGDVPSSVSSSSIPTGAIVTSAATAGGAPTRTAVSAASHSSSTLSPPFTQKESDHHSHADNVSLSTPSLALAVLPTLHANLAGDSATATTITAVGKTDTTKNKAWQDEKGEEDSGCQKKQTGKIDLLSLHLRRDLEEAMIGRPEGHGPRDMVEEEFEEDGDASEDDVESRSDDAARGNDAEARAARRKEEKRKAKKSMKNKTKKSVTAAIAPPATSMTASTREHNPGDALTMVSAKKDTTWRSPVTTGAATMTNTTQSSNVPLDDKTSGADADGNGDRHSGGENDELQQANEKDDGGLCMEEKGQSCGSGKAAQSSKRSPKDNQSKDEKKQSSLLESEAHGGAEDANCNNLQSSSSLVPRRPNFQLFSSRLEPHAPLSLYSLFEYDVSTDAAAVGCNSDSPTAGADLNEKENPDLSTSANVSNARNDTVEFRHGATLPSYVQHDLLRENERRQAEPKSSRRPSHALYECGMLATTRGRSFLFLLREDCVHALLYYLSSASAPIFIGAYIEPVDTTSVSYGGAVRLQKPESVHIPLEYNDNGKEAEETADVENGRFKSNGGSGDGGTRSSIEKMETFDFPKRVENSGEQLQSNGATSDKERGEVSAAKFEGVHSSTSADARRVIIGPVEGMEVMAEYFKSKGLITCFSVSDVERIAPGPSAAHRLRKMILPSSHPSTSTNSSKNRGSVPSKEHELTLRQAREAARYGHTFTYAASEFCDGDLVVYNFDERKWEHYEHVQLRRRFAAKAAAAACSPFRGGSSSSPMGRSSVGSSSLNSTTALGLMPSLNEGGCGIRGEGGVGRVSGRVHDDVAAVLDGSIGGASSVADSSMSARLLCVGLDELLLSWTKWVVDNRFYEDRSDLGWLNLPDGCPLQLSGRYFLWSFRHNNQRYFYGVIPKFAKGRLRRQKLMERNRKKKELVTPRAAAPATNRTASPRTAQSTTKDADMKEQQRAAKASKSHSPFTKRPNARRHSTGTNDSHGGRGHARGNAGAHADPYQLSSGLSSLQSGGGHTPLSLHSQGLPGEPQQRAVFANPAAKMAAFPSQQQQHQRNINTSLQPLLDDGVDYEESSIGSRTHGFAQASSQGFRQQQQQQQQQQCMGHSSHNISTDSMEAVAIGASNQHEHPCIDGYSSNSMLTSNNFNAPPRRSSLTKANANNSSSSGIQTYSSPQQQQLFTSHSQALYPPSQPSWLPNSPHYGGYPGAAAAAAAPNSHFPSVCVGNNVVYSQMPPSLAKAGSSTQRVPLLGPPPLQPLGRHPVPHSPLLSSPAQLTSVNAVDGGGAQNYYYQYGGNTFIQDGKCHENEYYPPLPPNTPFHPASQANAAKLVPLPHPQTGRGGIPAMFRYWGPVGFPSTRSSTLARPAMPRPLAQQQQHASLPSNAGRPMSPSGPSASISAHRLLMQSTAHSNSLNGNANLPGAGTAVAIAHAVPSALTDVFRNFTVRVRRRGASTAAASSGPSSLSASGTAMALASPTASAATATNSPFSNVSAAGFPASPVSHAEQQVHVLGDAVTATATTAATSAEGVTQGTVPSMATVGFGGDLNATPPRRLSPTSMLPANLINEGSKTKGESVLRVDEDMYVQREAFRWNPYASTKWVAGKHETD